MDRKTKKMQEKAERIALKAAMKAAEQGTDWRKCLWCGGKLIVTGYEHDRGEVILVCGKCGEEFSDSYIDERDKIVPFKR